MKGRFIKRKICQGAAWLSERPYYLKRFYIRKRIGKRNFTIIANNCWAGRAYQYLGMPYLSPTVGMYFFAEDYLKFVTNLRFYLSLDLKFIDAKKSKYVDTLTSLNQLDKPIGLLDDVLIVFLHYHSENEAYEKWTRRTQRVNYDHIILKFSNMNLCTEDNMRQFSQLEFPNKFMLNSRRLVKYPCEIYWNGPCGNKGEILSDTEAFPGNLDLVKLLTLPKVTYPLTLPQKE